MPFTYSAITANCGNDSIGEVASATIANFIEDNELDFVVINCQEVNFDKTKQQLEYFVKEKGYEVKCLSQMATHTKVSTQFHSNTGIASFVSHKIGCDVAATSHVKHDLIGIVS
jgi:hypothetical protein